MTDTAAPPDPDFDALIESAGSVLAAHLAGGTYIAGYESGQAKELIENLDGDGRAALLVHLVNVHFLGMVDVDCLLDECNERSYDLMKTFAEQLHAEIVHQQREADALYQLTVDAICDEADTIKSLADYKAERTEGGGAEHANQN